MICTKAWLMIGITHSLPGILKSDDKRIAFIDGEGSCIFDFSLTEISKVTSPWYYFGGGLKLQFGESEHRLSFIQPNDDVTYSEPLPNSDVSDMSGFAAVRAWKSFLTKKIV